LASVLVPMNGDYSSVYCLTYDHCDHATIFEMSIGGPRSLNSSMTATHTLVYSMKESELEMIFKTFLLQQTHPFQSHPATKAASLAVPMNDDYR
jgi:hypothetical protein